MKLLTKTSLAILLVTLTIFGSSGFILFNLIKTSVKTGADKDLLSESKFMEELLEKSPDLVSLEHPTVLINPIPGKSFAEPKPVYSDTLIQEQVGLEGSSNRMLTFEKDINGQVFQVQILHPMVGDELFLQNFLYYLFWVTLALVSLIMLSVFLISRQIWKPFYSSLQQIAQFDLRQSPPELPLSNIHEFQQLNGMLEKLTQKVHKDFRNLKEFFEESSHELQTPLAVVRTKLDRLAQSPNLTREEIDSLLSAQTAVRRLTNTAKQLLMIGRIENMQFGEGENLELNQVFETQLKTIEELLLLKGVQVETNLEEVFLVKIPAYLADTLASNLLANALNHNLPNGKIIISTTPGTLEISNPGNASLDPERIFDRFVAGNESSSTGLGLAIVKRICDAYHLQISYQFENGLHIFLIQKT